MTGLSSGNHDALTIGMLYLVHCFAAVRTQHVYNTHADDVNEDHAIISGVTGLCSPEHTS